MKNFHIKFYRLNSWILLLIAFFIFSCRTDKWLLPSAFVGSWETSKNKITVRYKTSDQRHSQFISDSAIIKIKIKDDKTVSGFIGQAAIDKGKIVKSRSIPGLRKVEYSIECSLTGKIFEGDPLDVKKVDIWLSLLVESGKMKADVRSGGTVFPMALALLEKVNE